ncbi:hypothetical protein [Nonomuraea dietziae]|uniref:Lipoprotein n=1 Tax=Nonomuraea dietziae TaxID=65515 RepID=A0A7W5V9F4_9ACTN|nr:hypothetical protein [Nonomuraea dietziae]MBB3727515.1 hypothetical protein [Nonomuraea dietziae]
MTRAWVAVLSVAGALAAGCGAGGTPGLSMEAAHTCHGEDLPLDVLKRGRPATELGQDGREALRGTGVGPVGDLAAWRIVEDGTDRLTLVRQLERPDVREQGTRFTHALLKVERFGPRGADGRPGWHLRTSTRCDLRRKMDALGVADLTLDPARPLARTQGTVHLLVTERACASGRAAEGRVRVFSREETPQEVRLIIGVEPQGGARTCQRSPATPFAVELDAPLGDRVLKDVGVYPAREIGP